MPYILGGEDVEVLFIETAQKFAQDDAQSFMDWAAENDARNVAAVLRFVSKGQLSTVALARVDRVQREKLKGEGIRFQSDRRGQNF